MTDLIVLLVLAVPIGLAIRYVVKAKKKGIHCIGCPDGATCSGCCHGSAPADGADQDTCSCDEGSCKSHHS